MARDYDKKLLREKKLKPPFVTDLFMYNFDDSEFAREEEVIMRAVENERKIKSFSPVFDCIEYECPEIRDLKIKLQASTNVRNFFKTKATQKFSSSSQSRHNSINSQKGSI